MVARRGERVGAGGRDAEEDEEARHLLLVVREVLRRRRLPADVRLAVAGDTLERCSRSVSAGSLKVMFVAAEVNCCGATARRDLLGGAARLPRLPGRTFGSKARIVPVIETLSGMMLNRTPPWMVPTVTTAGLVVRSTWRLTIA